ncbi:MAG: hypothetical protein KDC05_11830 [Bacteroidales bacterium]|nr:hypothetical protein [Bacteroidales bacterium]
MGKSIKTSGAEATGKNAEDLFIVGIGASAGGLLAIESFFKNSPVDAGVA